MIEAKIHALNAELKSVKCPVKVRLKGDRLYLRATLPPKPGSGRETPFQQDIALGIYANPEGIKRAKAEALKIGGLLSMGGFSWDDYYTPRNRTETVAQWIQAFEKDYFSRRERNGKSETTWKKDYCAAFRRLPSDEKLTKEVLLEAIAQTNPDTRARQRVCTVYGALAKFAGIDLDVTRLKGKYSPKKVQARDLPSDEQIVEWREKIPSEEWRWVYGVIAAYGLRNHEAFHVDLNSIRESELAVILDGKTGARRILPCPVSWWKDWELYRPKLPNVTARNNSDFGLRVTQYFKRIKPDPLPFKIYDLRHAWALRAAIARVDPSIASRLQGHSLSVHSEIYMNFLDDGHLQKVLEDIRSGRE